MYKPEIHISRKAALSAQEQEPLFWEVIPPPKYPRRIIQGTIREDTEDSRSIDPSKARRKTRPTKTTPNPNNIYLKDCWFFADVKDELPPCFASDLDDILSGISKLDLGGNTRPIRKGMLFHMLRDLDEVSTNAVREYVGASDSYSRKIAALLRIAVNELNKIVDEGR